MTDAPRKADARPDELAELERLAAQVETLREGVRSLAHGEHSGRAFANELLAATARTDATPLFLASDPVPVSELRRRYPDGWTTDATGDAKAPADDSGA